MTSFGVIKCATVLGAAGCPGSKGFAKCSPSSYLNPHRCSNGTVDTTIGMTVANATIVGGAPIAWKYGGTCYYFVLSDTPVSSVATVITPADVIIFSGGCVPCAAVCCAPNPTPSFLDVTFNIVAICGCYQSSTGRDVKGLSTLGDVNQTFRAALDVFNTCSYKHTFATPLKLLSYVSAGGVCTGSPVTVDIESFVVTPFFIDMISGGSPGYSYFTFVGAVDTCNGGMYSNQLTSCAPVVLGSTIYNPLGTGGSALVVPVA